MGRLDWWNIKDEHTPYQWACQRVMQNVSPYGPQRDDIRAAFNTASIRVSHATGEVTTEQVREVIESLIEYLPCERTDDGLELDAEALRRMKEGG